MPRPARREARRISKFETWAWSPIIVLRIALTTIYGVIFYAGIVAIVAGIPLFSLTAPVGYSAPWGAVLAVSALIASIASGHDSWQKVEKWAGGVMTVMLSGYVVGINIVGFVSQDPTRQFGGAIAIAAFVLPVTRVIYLAAQTGKKHTPDAAAIPVSG